ncbi:MAG: serine hydrolase [Candidatus Pacebacteria bacterium]|nr:serine hydrolase [Candidatus Paceibacterota bacterium]MDD5356906.1 serine hydrolase [Candidatus Paceibacterota bacterium]
MDKALIQRLEKAISEKTFPGCVLGIVSRDGKRSIFPVGNFTYEKDSPKVTENTIYDLASITKSIPTSCVLLKLLEKGKVNIEDKVTDFIPEFGNFPEKKEVTIKNLLTYTLELQVPGLSSLKDKTSEEIVAEVVNAPLKSRPGSRFFYNNATALLIGFVIQKIIKEPLDIYAEREFFAPLGMSRTTFHPERFPKMEIAPTEIDDWRERVIQGEVHDESTFTLQKKYFFGIAGAFSTVPDFLNFQEMLLNGGVKNGKRYFSENMIQKMHTNMMPDAKGEPVGLGWNIYNPLYMGTKTSKEVFGKTGFTGTLVLTDPVKGVGFTLLSNRTFPKRPKDSNLINAVRGDIADIIFS